MRRGVVQSHETVPALSAHVSIRFFSLANIELGVKEEHVKARKTKRKPTGITGPVRVKTGKGAPKVDFLPVEFPTTKPEIEALVVRSFLASAPEGLLTAPLIDVLPNDENDLDFVDAGAATPTYIELMEIAPLENVGGSYTSASSSYKPYDFAESLLAKILKKSARYRVGPKTRLVLLTYVTDWRFILSQTVVALLQYWTLVRAHAFSEIYTFKPTSASDGFSNRIFPTPRAFWRGFNPDAFRDTVTKNIEPGAVHPIPSKDA
jgi:hypothetical protein